MIEVFSQLFVNNIIGQGVINVREKIAIQSLKYNNTYFDRQMKQIMTLYIDEKFLWI